MIQYVLTYIWIIWVQYIIARYCIKFAMKGDIKVCGWDDVLVFPAYTCFMIFSWSSNWPLFITWLTTTRVQ